MTLFGDLKKEADAIKVALKKGKRTIGRGISDMIEPPSTLEKIDRVIQDFWTDEVMPVAKELNSEIQDVFKEIDKEIKSLTKSSPVLSTLAKGFSDLSKQVEKSINKSPVLKKLSSFLESASKLIGSLAGTDKDRQKSWKKFQKSATDLGESVQKAVSKSIPKVVKKGGFSR